MNHEQQVIPGLRVSTRRRDSRLLFALVPNELLVLGGAVFVFVLVTLALSLISGAPLTLPTERVSPALGVSATAPLAVGLLGYAALRLVSELRRRTQRQPRDLARQIVIDLVYLALFVVVTYCHFHIKMWMPLLNPHLHDAFYYALDEYLRGLLDAAGTLRNGIAAWLPAPDLWYQGAQLSLFMLSFWGHALGHRRWHYHNTTALLLNLMLGPLTYLIAPAVGPFVFEVGPNAAATAAQQEMYRHFLAVQAQGTSWLASHGGTFFTTPLAAMPSLHMSLSCIVSWYALKAGLKVTWLLLPLSGWIILESTVSRWHYLVDLPAGVLLAALVIVFTDRLCRWQPEPKWVAGRGLFPNACTSAAQPTRPATRPPCVWVLTCHREGDNQQMIGLAEALGWPFEVKRMVHRRLELLPNLLLPTTLAGLDRQRSAPLEPPWPDLLILAFRANENIARWIRARSGGRARTCVIGRPWSPLTEFDLVVTTPQLMQPERVNVLHNALPLHRITGRGLRDAAARWAPTLEGLPRPRIAVLVGGSSGPYVFDRSAARRLGRQASMTARAMGGSLLVTTSARTSPAAADALLAAVDVPAYCYRWRRCDDRNPFLGFLALADAFIVTGESISMVTEACASGKTVLMFEFGGGPVAMRSRGGGWQTWPWATRREDLHVQTWMYALYMLLPHGRFNRTRDLRRVHEALLATGRARWLGDAALPPASGITADDMSRAVARVRALFEAPPQRRSLKQSVYS
jgi:mitochondrial fission protein ELM1